MAAIDEEGELLRSVASLNAQSILNARSADEEALRKQSELLRITLASIGDGVICTDADGRVTFMNGVAEALTGWPTAEAIGRPLPDVFHIVNEHTRNTVENPALQALSEGRIVGLANHTVLIARDGTERPIDDSAAPLKGDSDTPIGSVLVFRDVTERNRAEKAGALLAAIVDSSDDAIVSKSLDSTILSWNAGAQRLFGYTPEEAVGKSITLIIPLERRDEERAILERLCRGERIEHFETVRVTKDGRMIDISLTISPIRNAEGRIIGASKIARDITERKQTQRRQTEIEGDTLRLLELNRAILDNMGEGLYTVDSHGLVTYMNPAAERLFGWTCDELLGRRMHDVTHYKHPDGTPFPIEDCSGYQVLHHGVVLTDHEDAFIRKDGSFFSVSYCSSPLRSGPLTVGLVVVFRDTTEQKKAEERLKQSEERLRQLAADLSESNRRKDEFLATLAHELRNPLAPIRNGLQIIRLARDGGTAAEEARAMMERQLGNMVRLVDDLLDVSRISRGKLELRKERVELTAVLNNAVETSLPAVEHGGHELTISVPPDPIFVDADVLRLGQVFANLLNNAAKYSERGSRILLSAKRQAGEIAVSIKDSGVGIPREMLPKIFELFTQVDRSLERSQGGLGIGLTLVKRLVEMHGGTVEARSEGHGMGSEFVVRLPLQLSAAQEVTASTALDDPARPTRRRRLLVADDNLDSASSMATMLRVMGYEVVTANDGLQAVETAATFRPDVILMDIGMPKLNGLEACRRIREQPWGKDSVLIALTGWGQDEDKRRTEQAGFDHHLVKPVDPATLERLLASIK